MTKPKYPLCAVGNRYGRLTVVELIPGLKNSAARCACDCGGEVVRQRGGLVRGVAQSCGCLAVENSPLTALMKVMVKESDDCIETPTCRGPLGYGVVRLDGKNERAHRISYAHSTGQTLADLADVHIRHKCDNPACVNPRHLEPGTHADNMHDMFSRGRRIAAVGEQASKAKLVTQQVLELRRRAAAGEKRSNLALAFGIGKTSVRAIILRKSWRHV